MRLLLCCLLGSALATVAEAQTSATYRVTFESTWSASTHPDGFPANAHFSPLVGTSHTAAVSFWAPGATASDAIEAMAERGQTPLLLQAFADAMPDASPGTVGQDLPVSPGTAETRVVVSDALPLVTIVTMIAPSPDWFVGVHSLDLRVNGVLPDVAVVPLAVYDAGTDSGTLYLSANADTQPRAAVALLTSAPFAAGATVGTFTFERIMQTAQEDLSDAAFDLSPAFPNPSRVSATVTLTLDRPQVVSVRVLDALGRAVAVLADGPQAAGRLALRLDTSGLAAGAYTVVATGETAQTTRRVSVVR